MRLAMVYDYPVRRAGETLWTHRSYGAYVDALAPYFDRILLVAPQAPAQRTAELAYALPAANVGLAPLPFYERWTGSLRAMAATPTLLWRRRAEWDAVYVRLPCPLVLPTFAIGALLARPLCLHVVGDLLTQMADYPPGLQPLARSAARTFEWLTTRMAARALTITQGSALARRYARRGHPAHSVIESTVSDGDLWQRPAGGLHRPVRLLCVAALLDKKGIQHLIEAVASLQVTDPVSLTLVGSGPARTGLEALTARLGLADAVRFTGAITADEALRDAYRAADIFVLPSLAEGIPRVLIEAMAQSLPVVSTTVGGITDLVEHDHNGLLVAPGSPAALAAAVTRLTCDPALRGRLVTNGLLTARRYTREAHARAFAALLDDDIRRRFPGWRPAAVPPPTPARGAHAASPPGGSPSC